MAIPKYDEMYREILECLSDGQVHKSKEIKNIVAMRFSLSSIDREELLPSGRQSVFDNRLGWARTYLKKAGLIQSPSRGSYVITPAGKQVLAENPQRIDNDYLQRYESFCSFLSVDHIARENQCTTATAVSSQSPQDALDDAFQKINQALRDDLLSEIVK